MTLPVTVHFHDGETPLSLASRLAAANGYTSLEAFLSFTEINAKMISAGDPAAMTILSGWSGIGEERLRRFSISPGETRATWKLGSAEFSKDMRPGNRHRFCAHCIVDDLEREDGRPIARPWMRSWWLPRAIMSCQQHGVSLTEIDGEDVVDRNDFARFVADNIDRVRELAALPENSKSPPLDAYLRQRITGDVGDSFADGLAAYVVVELSAYAGWFIEKHEVPGSWDAADHTDETREKGFMALSAGRDAFVNLYVGAINRKQPTMRDIELFLGRILPWLRRNEDKPSHSAVVDLFVDMVVRHVPIGPGEKFIREVNVRHLHSVTSASAEYKLLPKRVRDLVIAAGLAKPSDLSDPQFRFDAELARPVLEEALDTLTSSEVAEIMGTHIDRIRGIMDAGLIPRAENGPADVRVYSRIRKKDLAEFQQKLFDGAKPFKEAADVLPIKDVCRVCMCTMEVLIQMILDGEIESIARSGSEQTFLSLYLNAVEVGRILANRRRGENSRHDDLLTIRQAERALGTTTYTIRALFDHGLLKYEDRQNLRSGHVSVGVSRSEIDKFSKRYASLSQIARASKRDRASMKVRLEDLGIHPVFEPEGFIARFYERTKIKAAGLPI